MEIQYIKKYFEFRINNKFNNEKKNSVLRKNSVQSVSMGAKKIPIRLRCVVVSDI